MMGTENSGVKIDKQKVEALMERQGIDSFKQLAQVANVHPNTVYNCLDNESFDSKTLIRLARALQCQPPDLMTWYGFVSEPFSLAPASL